MRITLSQNAGFCDGVRRACDIVFHLRILQARKPVFVLGSLVHNNSVVEKIEKKGIKKIDIQTLRKSKSGEIGTLIVTAHGAGPNIYKQAKAKGIDLIDTTCPKVAKVQRLAKVFFDRGNQVVLAGDKDHKEVVSIFEWGGKKAVIISDDSDLKKMRIDPKRKVTLLAQTTQNRDFFNRVAVAVADQNKNIEIVETICLATAERQEEVKKMAKENETMIIIGSPESANSNRLFEISKSLNPKTHFVEKSNQVRKEWFTGAKKVGVSAGASSPDWIIREIIKKIRSFSPRQKP